MQPASDFLLDILNPFIDFPSWSETVFPFSVLCFLPSDLSSARRAPYPRKWPVRDLFLSLSPGLIRNPSPRGSQPTTDRVFPWFAMVDLRDFFGCSDASLTDTWVGASLVPPSVNRSKLLDFLPVICVDLFMHCCCSGDPWETHPADARIPLFCRGDPFLLKNRCFRLAKGRLCLFRFGVA